MLQSLSESVSVTFNKLPTSLTWADRDYSVKELGLHHTYYKGSTLHHVFSVVGHPTTEPLTKLNIAKWGASTFFRLNLDTTSLRWTLEEVSDGLPD